MSSGSEPYIDKLRTYTGSAPYLAQTLVADFYKSNSAMKNFIRETELTFEAVPEFNSTALENRSKLLYSIVKELWHV